jgi:hypothetical protein
MGETAVLLVDNVLEVPPLATPDEPAQAACWVPWFGDLAGRVVSWRQVIPPQVPPVGKRWVEVVLGDAAPSLGDAQGPGRIVADAAGEKASGGKKVADDPVVVGLPRLPRRFSERVRMPKASVRAKLSGQRWEDPPGQVQAALIHCRNAARKAGWDLDEDEVYDPLPIQASTLRYSNDWSGMADAANITTLPEWTYYTGDTTIIKSSTGGLGTPNVHLWPATAWTSRGAQTQWLQDRPDQEMWFQFYYPNVYACGPTYAGVRCSSDAWGYYHYQRYRHGYSLTTGGGLQLGSSSPPATQEQEFSLQAQGTSIYSSVVEIGGGVVASIGPVTDTYEQTAGTGYNRLQMTYVNGMQLVHQLKLWNLGDEPSTGRPWLAHVLPSGRYI